MSGSVSHGAFQGAAPSYSPINHPVLLSDSEVTCKITNKIISKDLSVSLRCYFLVRILGKLLHQSPFP